MYIIEYYHNYYQYHIIFQNITFRGTPSLANFIYIALTQSYSLKGLNRQNHQRPKWLTFTIIRGNFLYCTNCL